MSSGEKQLVEDFEQVQKLLKSYPNIKIISTEGDPPEQYDIEYSIKGYKTNPDGSASPDNKHQIRINLPFGYPHFPPTAKPITPIFHPDIDPDAIRIADFWQENTSLPELIIHIGQMICGNHCTTEEPFNQNAFDWFKERESWLPFDILEPRDDEEVEEEPETDATSSAEETDKTFVPATDLDILKDDIDFPFDEDEEDALPFDVGEEIEEISDLEEDEGGLDLDLGAESSDSLDQSESADKEIDGKVGLDTEDSSDEVSFDFGDLDEEAQPEEILEDLDLDLGEKSLDSFDLKDSVEEESDDKLELGPEDISDEVSFDFGDLDEEAQPEGEPAELSDSSDLETEPSAAKQEEEIPLAFDDLASAIDVEEAPSQDSEDVGISLDDLPRLEPDDDSLDFGLADETEENLDFGIDEESIDLSGDATADLSGLEDEQIFEEQEVDISSEESEGEEEKILSALSLDEEFASDGNLAERSEVIGNLIDQKQIFAAKKVFTEFADSDDLPDKIEHEQAIANAISEAEELFKKADKHERKGELEKAGLILDLVANITTDFPGLDHARNRIRESIMGGDGEKPDTVADKEEPKDDAQPEVLEETKKEKPKVKLGFKVPVRLIVTIIILLVLGGIGAGAGYVYLNDSEHIEDAQINFTKAEQLVKGKEFKQAQKEFDSTLATLEKIILFQGKEKEALFSKITGITNTSLFREGLKGRVLYGDTYVSVETAQIIDKFNSQKKLAERALKAEKIDIAISAYDKSLSFAVQIGFDKEQEAIKKKIQELKKKLALSNAKQFEEDQDWLGAKASYQEALELGKGISKPEEQEVIARQLATATYHNGLSVSLSAVNDSQWQKSIDSLGEVRGALEKYPNIVSESQKTEVEELLIQSHLYLYLAEAKKYFDDKMWKEAIDTYNDAITLLNENEDLLGDKSTENIEKIKKTILTTNVAKEQAKVEESKANKELEQTAKHYEAIVKLIEKSAFKDDEILGKILDDAQTQNKEIKKQLLINKKEQWLTDNYDSIFRDNYPSAKSSELMNPKVEYVKKEGNFMIFNLSCTELKQGRKFRLQLYYQNDLVKNAWSLYSGEIK